MEMKRNPVKEVGHDEPPRGTVHEQDLHKVPGQLQLVHQRRLQQICTGCIF